MDETWVIDPDSAAYVGGAWSIVEGKGYAFSGFPQTKYPPLFSMVLAGTASAGGEKNFRLMQYIVALFWILAVFFTYLLFSGRGIENSPFAGKGMVKNPFTGIVFALLMASSIYMLQYAVIFLRTEVVFTAFILAAVLAANRIQQSKKPPLRWLLGFVLLFSCAYLTRMAGVALVGAFLLVAVLDRNAWIRREGRWGLAALVILLCAAAPGAWALRNKAVAAEGSTSYGAEFVQEFGLDLTKNRDLEMESINLPGMCRRVLDNADVFAESSAKMLLNSNRGGARLWLRLILGALCTFGLLVSLVRRRSFADYFCLLYLGLYLIWPFNQQQRFYMPIFPFLVEYAAVTVLLLNRLLPALLRHAGIWYLFFAFQIPLLVVVYGGRSQEPRVLGRYSYHYLAFALCLTLFLLVMDIYLVAERKRPGGLKGIMKRLRASLPALYLVSFTALGFNELLRVYPEKREAFVESRAVEPVPPAFEKIEVHPELLEMAEWILDHTAADDVIMCDIPKMLHILTGRRTVPFTFFGKQRRLAATVYGLRPDYVYYSGEIPWVYGIFTDACRGYEKIYSRRIDVGGGVILEPALYRIP